MDSTSIAWIGLMIATFLLGVVALIAQYVLDKSLSKLHKRMAESLRLAANG